MPGLFDEAKHPRDPVGRFAHVSVHPSTLSVGDQLRVKRHTTPGVTGIYAALPSAKGGHTATVTSIDPPGSAHVPSVHFRDHAGREGMVAVSKGSPNVRVHKVVPPEAEPAPPPAPPEHDVTASVSGFVPAPGQTHARCRVDGKEHELSKFPTMAGGRRGTECRDHRDARRDALKRGEKPDQDPGIPKIIGTHAVGDRVTVQHEGHPHNGQTVTITGTTGATGGSGGGGTVTTDKGPLSRYTRVTPAAEHEREPISRRSARQQQERSDRQARIEREQAALDAQKKQEETYRHLPSPQEQVDAAEAAHAQAREQHAIALAEETRLNGIIRTRGTSGVGSGVIASQRLAQRQRREAEDAVRDRKRELDALRKAHGIEAPRDMSEDAVVNRVEEALRDSGNQSEENQTYTTAHGLDPDRLRAALRDAEPDDSHVTVKPAGGYEVNLHRDDARALAGIIERRYGRGLGRKDIGITSGPTGGPGVGTFSGGTITVPAFSVIQRDAPPSSPGAETALRSLRRQHNAVHGDDDARRARIDPLRRSYARGYRKAKGTGRGAAALDRVRQHLAALAGDGSGPDPDLLPEKHPGHRSTKGLSVVERAILRGSFVDDLVVTEGKSLFDPEPEPYRYGGGTDGFDPSALVQWAATATEEAKRLRDDTVAYAEALRTPPPLADRLSTKSIEVEDRPRARVTERKADAVLGSVAPPGQAPRLLYQSGTDDPALTWASSPDTPADVTLDRKTGGLTLDISDDLVVALVSVTGVVDEVDDLPEPGVYAETLRLRIPKGIWSHDWDVWVSRTEAIEELLPGDSRLPATTRLGDPWPREAGGLLVATRFNKATNAGRDALSNVKFFDEGPLGPQTEWSVGYNVRPGKAFRRRDGVRVIRSWDCFEYGPVLFGAASLSGTLQLAGTKASAMRQSRRLHV